MKCDVCKIRDAVVFVRQVTAHSTVELHLCPECAKAKGIAPNGNQLEMSLSGILSGLLDNQKNLTSQESNKVCSVCGLSLQEIRKQKKVGCAECYSNFKNEISDLLESEGIAGPYTGSMPNRLTHFKSVLTDRMMLQKKLEEAIATEDYERAALFRDRLKVLEKTGIELADPDILKEGGASE